MRFHYGAIFIDRLHFSFNGLMPFEYPFMFWVFRSKAFDFFEMPFKVQMFIIVSVCGNCAWDICGKERPHNFNKIIQHYFKLDSQVQDNYFHLKELTQNFSGWKKVGWVDLDVQSYDLHNYKLYKTQMEQYDNSNSKTQYLIETKSVSSFHSNPESIQLVQIQQEYPLIERYYHNCRKNQYQNLLESNINAILKKKLFGFTRSAQVYYKTHFHSQLVFQKHPLKGRTIMPLEKFQQREFDRQRTAEIQQTNIETKLVKPKSIYMPLPVVAKNNQKYRNDLNSQLSPKKRENVDESLEDLIAAGSQKKLIGDQRL